MTPTILTISASTGKKKKLGSVLALCFTQTSERYHHWRVFAHGSGGVCESFKRSELVKAVKPVPDLRCESVTYLRLNQIRRRTLDPEELPFLKRYPFQDEREFRMVWESKKKGKSAFDIPVPLSCIDKVILSPWLRESLAGHLKGMLKRIEGCTHLRITRSTLICNEQWKNLGESVAEEKRVVGT